MNKTPKTVYQLHAVGQQYFAEQNGMSGRRVICSKRVFELPEAAEAYREEFKRIVTSPLHGEDENYLVDNLDLKILVLELGLVSTNDQ